jgi:hypothetical protein
VLSNNFKINKCDKCVYVKTKNKSYVIIYFYVDDMLILGNNKHMIKSTKNNLTNKFDLKDLGVADIILGFKISWISNGLVMS